MRIVISGTYSTGKTTTSLALSLLTGIQATHARTMREILPATFPGKRLEECDFHELIELGMRRFTERIVIEKQLGNSFISDGCPLQEWLYGTTRMITGLNPSEKPWKLKLHRIMNAPEWRVFEQTITGFGKVVKEYTKNHYDAIVHLPVEFPFDPDGHRPTSESFREKSEILLQDTYKELGLDIVVASGTMEKRLEKMITALHLSPVMSIQDAIEKANMLRKEKFDSVKIEKERTEGAGTYDLFRKTPLEK